MAIRSSAQRKADTLAKLTAPEADAWVATGSGIEGSTAFLIPLSVAWLNERLVLATASESRTARNLARQAQARLALGGTRDVVLIDAMLEIAVDVDTASTAVADGFAGQAEWDPRDTPGEYRFLILRPVQIQAWQEVDEFPGRMLMREGSWLA